MELQTNNDDSITVGTGKIRFRIAIDDTELCVWDEDLKCLNVRQDEDSKEAYVSIVK
jgi:hypothetical protein